MALSDPLSLNVDGTATPFARIETGARKAIYASADGSLKLTISHSDAGNGRTRHLVRYDAKWMIPSELNSAVNVWKTGAVYIVFDQPDFGFPPDAMNGLFTTLKLAMDNALTCRIVGNES